MGTLSRWCVATVRGDWTGDAGRKCAEWVRGFTLGIVFTHVLCVVVVNMSSGVLCCDVGLVCDTCRCAAHDVVLAQWRYVWSVYECVHCDVVHCEVRT